MTDPAPDPSTADPAVIAALTEQIRALSEEVLNLRKDGRALAKSVERVEGSAARSAQGLDEFEASLDQMSAQLAAAAPPPGPEPVANTAGGEQPAAAAAAVEEELDMAVLFEWVRLHIGDWAQRKLARTTGSASGWIWCAQWFEHPEAVTMLWLLRGAWLEAVIQGRPALLAYFRDCYYPTLRFLSDPQGPLHACTAEEHKDSPFVPVYPAGWFAQTP